MNSFIRRIRPVIIAAGLLLFLFSCSQRLLAQNKDLTNSATTTEKPASAANPVCLIMPMTGPHRACALWDEGTRWRLGNTLPAPPAPKKLVYWNGTEVGTAAAADVLPAQTGNAGKILSTDGTDPVWTDAPETTTQIITQYIEVGSPDPVPPGTGNEYGNFKKLFKNGKDVVSNDRMTYVLCIGQDCTVGTDLTNTWVGLQAGTITRCTVFAKTAPTDADLIVDITKNGTSIFDVSKLTLPATQRIASITTIANPTIAVNDLFGVDITQVGATVKGKDLTVSCLIQY